MVDNASYKEQAGQVGSIQSEAFIECVWLKQQDIKTNVKHDYVW